MEIYIDIVYILNALIILITLLSTLIIMNTNLEIKKMLVGVLVLSTYTFSIYIKMNTFLGYLALLILLMFFLFKDKKGMATIIFYIVHTTYIYSFTAVMKECRVVHQVLIVPISFSWMYTFVLSSFIILLYTGYIFQMKERLTIKNFKYSVSIRYNNCDYEIEGFMDSGNQAVYNNKIVIFMLKEIVTDVEIIEFISIDTVGEKQVLPIIEIDYLIFENKKYLDVYVALVDTLEIEGVSCLLNIKLLYGGWIWIY